MRSRRRESAAWAREHLLPALAVASGILLGALGSRALAAEPASSLELGRAVFQKWCLPCHGPGHDRPGTMALAALYKGAKPAVLEERTDLTPDVVKHYVRHGVSVMPFFRKTEISDTDLDALAAFLARKH